MFEADNQFLGDDLLYGTDVPPFNPEQSPQLEKLLNDDDLLDSGVEFYSPLHSNKSGPDRNDKFGTAESSKKKADDKQPLKLQSTQSTTQYVDMERNLSTNSHSRSGH